MGFSRSLHHFGLCLALGAALGALPYSHADAQRDVPKATVVQLDSMMAPSAMRRNRDGYVIVTPLVEIKRGVPVQDICAFAVRVKETIFLSLHANPVTAVRDDEIVIPDHLRRTIIERLNHVVGGDKVEKIHIIEGAMSMGTGVSAKLPYATVAGCKEFLEMGEGGAGGAGGGH